MDNPSFAMYVLEWTLVDDTHVFVITNNAAFINIEYMKGVPYKECTMTKYNDETEFKAYMEKRYA